MRIITNALGFAGLIVLSANAALAQTGMPTSQPNLLQIYREEVKVGHNAAHEAVEIGWPAAYEKAKSTNYYLALVSLTGAPEVWFVAPFESHAALGESMKADRSGPLAAELARLQRADAEHLNNARGFHAVARKDLSHGEYPDTAKQRFWEITTFRMRPGRGADFEAAAKAYGGAVGRSGRTVAYRVYQVVAGMPGDTFLVFSSSTSFADFDTGMANDEAIGKAMTEADRKIFEKFFEGLVVNDSQRFELSPTMSYVSAEVRATDPAFWMPKKPAAKKTTTTTTELKPKPMDVEKRR